MSVMLISDTVYNRVLVSLRHLTFDSEHTTIEQDRLRNFTFLHGCKNKTGLEHAIKCARAQNYRKYRNKYRELKEDIQYSELKERYNTVVYTNNWQLLKSLEFINFQLEVNNPLLETLINLVMRHCIETTPQYYKAKWG